MGFFSKLFKSNKDAPETAQPEKENVKEEIATPQLPKKEKYDIVIPSQKNGAPLAYKYSVDFLLTNRDALEKNVTNNEWMLEPKEIDGKIHLFSNDSDIGILKQKEDMLFDWIRRNDPYLLCIESVKSDSDTGKAFLVFYRDKRKGNEWREQTVVALTAFKSQYKQELIMFLSEGEELQIEEDFDDHVIVSSAGEEIGRLPAKYAKRYLQDGVYAVFFETSEETDDFKEKPYVRIYWNDRA